MESECGFLESLHQLPEGAAGASPFYNSSLSTYVILSQDTVFSLSHKEDEEMFSLLGKNKDQRSVGKEGHVSTLPSGRALPSPPVSGDSSAFTIPSSVGFDQ